MKNNSPVVILVRPQLGENIGAVARAMSNFGLSELRLVAPRDGWPNEKASHMASGGQFILDAAKLYPDFTAALEGIHFAYATTARSRDMEKPVLEPQAAMQEASGFMGAGKKAAIVFGPERTGLENDDITLCNTLISIPTAPENSSLNIAQSAVVMGYEWYRQSAASIIGRGLPDIAPKEDWQGLYDQFERYLDEANYFRVDHKKPLMFQNLKNMLMRGQFTSQEIQTLRGILRVLWEGRLPRRKP